MLVLAMMIGDLKYVPEPRKRKAPMILTEALTLIGNSQST